MKILVCGSRYYANSKRINKVLSALPKDTIIVHGNCDGADKLSGEAAKTFGMTVIPVSAEWKKYGHSAGPIRNAQMLKEHPDIEKALVFHEALEQSTGTKDMINKLNAKNIPMDIYD